jgi:hypothetical protein
MQQYQTPTEPEASMGSWGGHVSHQSLANMPLPMHLYALHTGATKMHANQCNWCLAGNSHERLACKHRLAQDT